MNEPGSAWITQISSKCSTALFCAKIVTISWQGNWNNPAIYLFYTSKTRYNVIENQTGLLQIGNSDLSVTSLVKHTEAHPIDFLKQFHIEKPFSQWLNQFVKWKIDFRSQIFMICDRSCTSQLKSNQEIVCVDQIFNQNSTFCRLCYNLIHKCGHTKQPNKERRKGKTSIFVLGVKALNLHCQKVATQNPR